MEYLGYILLAAVVLFLTAVIIIQRRMNAWKWQLEKAELAEVSFDSQTATVRGLTFRFRRPRNSQPKILALNDLVLRAGRKNDRSPFEIYDHEINTLAEQLNSSGLLDGADRIEYDRVTMAAVTEVNYLINKRRKTEEWMYKSVPDRQANPSPSS